MSANPARGALLGAVLAVALAGCVPQASEPTPTPDATAFTPVFASDEEALAAAAEAYGAYLAMSDLIAQEGGREPQRIAPFVTEEQLAVELASFEGLAQRDIQQVGAASLLSFQLQSIQPAALAAYACTDFGSTSLVRPDGSIVESQRLFSTVMTVVHVVWTDSRPPDLRVSSVEPWEQSRQCQ